MASLEMSEERVQRQMLLTVGDLLMHFSRLSGAEKNQSQQEVSTNLIVSFFLLLMLVLSIFIFRQLAESSVLLEEFVSRTKSL